MTGKRNSSQPAARVYFHFARLVCGRREAGQRRARERLPGEGCQEPRSPASQGQLPGCNAPARDSLQAGLRFPKSHPPCSVYQDKNAKHVNGYEPLCLFFQLKIKKDQPYRNRDTDIEHRLWTRRGKKRVGRVASSIKIYTLQCVH